MAKKSSNKFLLLESSGSINPTTLIPLKRVNSVVYSCIDWEEPKRITFFINAIVLTLLVAKMLLSNKTKRNDFAQIVKKVL